MKKQIYLMSHEESSPKLFASETFKKTILAMIKREDFGELRFINGIHSHVRLEMACSVAKALSGIEGEAYSVSYIYPFGDKRTDNKPNVYDTSAPQGFLLVDAEAAVDCFFARCLSANPRLAVPSDKDVWRKKGSE